MFSAMRRKLICSERKREEKMLRFRMQKKREESIQTMVISISLLFQRLGQIPDLSEGLAALI